MSSRTTTLIVFVTIVAAGVAYVVWPTDTQAPSTAPSSAATATDTPNPAIILNASESPKLKVSPSPSVSPTPGFTSYEDPKKRFKAGVPKDWKAEVVSATNDSAMLPLEERDHVILKKPTGEYIGITLHPAILNPSLDDWLAARDKEGMTAYEGQPSKKVLTTKLTVVSGYPALERKEEWLAAGFTTVVTYVMAEGNVYVIELIPQAELAASDLRSLYEAVVGSLVIAPVK